MTNVLHKNSIELTLEKLKGIERYHNPSPTALTNARQFVAEAFVANTVWPSVSPDGDDITFYWVAKRWSIIVDFYSDGGVWWSLRNIQWRDFKGHREDGSHIGEELRLDIAAFTNYVVSLNPNWRTMLRDLGEHQIGYGRD